MLAQAGIKREELNIQPQQVSVTPFVDGTIDVVTATRYNEFYTLMTRMGRDKLHSFASEDYGITFPRDTLITSEAIIRDKPALVRGMVRASIRGWKAALADPKAAVDDVMKLAPTLDRPAQDFMLAEIAKLMVAGNAAQQGLFWIDDAAVKSAHDFLLKYEVVKKPVDLKATFDRSFIDAIPVAERRA